MLNGKMLKKQEPVTVQQTSDVHPRFGTHECVPYAHVGIYPVGRTPIHATCAALEKIFLTVTFFMVLRVDGCSTNPQLKLHKVPGI